MSHVPPNFSSLSLGRYTGLKGREIDKTAEPASTFWDGELGCSEERKTRFDRVDPSTIMVD